MEFGAMIRPVMGRGSRFKQQTAETILLSVALFEDWRGYTEEFWRGTPIPCRSSLDASSLSSSSANERPIVLFKRPSQYLGVALRC